MVIAIGPESAAETFVGPIESVASDAGVAFVFGLAVALWSASGYVGAFIRASNVIYETREGRAILGGHDLNAELERGVEIEEGRSGAEREIQLEPRSDPDG